MADTASAMVLETAASMVSVSRADGDSNISDPILDV